MNKINYQRELDQILAEITAKGEVPTLLLHSCCAPCSSYVLSYLASYFRITLYYYNPNISPKEEYQKRVQEQMGFTSGTSAKNLPNDRRRILKRGKTIDCGNSRHIPARFLHCPPAKEAPFPRGPASHIVPPARTDIVEKTAVFGPAGMRPSRTVITVKRKVPYEAECADERE